MPVCALSPNNFLNLSMNVLKEDFNFLNIWWVILDKLFLMGSFLFTQNIPLAKLSSIAAFINHKH